MSALQRVRSTVAAAALGLLGVSWSLGAAGPVAAQTAMCADPTETCSATLAPQCVSRLGAGSVAARPAAGEAAGAESCDDQFERYRDCLALVAQQCSGGEAAPQAGEVTEAERAATGHAGAKCPPEIELRLWDAVKESADAAILNHFIKTCPDSAFTPLVQAKLAAATGTSAPPPAPGGPILTPGGPPGAVPATGPAPATVPGAAPAAAPGAATGAPACPLNYERRGGLGDAFTCVCAAGAFGGRVWGTDVYTTDSALCAAALHAGAISASGGEVTVRPSAGRPAYQGSSRNGVTTGSWGAYGASYLFVGERAPGAEAEPRILCPSDASGYRGRSVRITCQCAPTALRGAVWGSGYYTDDSSVCRAALHAGVIGAAGGEVTLVTSPGRAAYQGSSQNDVATQSYGPWGGTFYFEP